MIRVKRTGTPLEFRFFFAFGGERKIMDVGRDLKICYYYNQNINTGTGLKQQLLSPEKGVA